MPEMYSHRYGPRPKCEAKKDPKDKEHDKVGADMDMSPKRLELCQAESGEFGAPGSQNLLTWDCCCHVFFNAQKHGAHSALDFHVPFFGRNHEID